MLLRSELPIGPDETAPELTARLAQAGAPLIVETLRRLESGEITPEPQDNSQATLAPPLKKNDGLIDWLRPAAQIYNRIRALQPWPSAFTSFRGKNCQIWGRPALAAEMADATVESAAGTVSAGKTGVFVTCGEGTLALEFVQLEGRKKITAREFANGARLALGERFGS
jgi:methionyl-tRNA formyltransferase